MSAFAVIMMLIIGGLEIWFAKGFGAWSFCILRDIYVDGVNNWRIVCQTVLIRAWAAASVKLLFTIYKNIQIDTTFEKNPAKFGKFTFLQPKLTQIVVCFSFFFKFFVNLTLF